MNDLAENIVEISAELPPPRETRQTTYAQAVANFDNTVNALNSLGPLWKWILATVTLGAGGSGGASSEIRKASFDALKNLRRTVPKIPAAAHLTCNGLDRDEMDYFIRDVIRHGVRHFLALGGDPKRDESIPEERKRLYHQKTEDLIACVAATTRSQGISNIGISVAVEPDRGTAPALKRLQEKIVADPDLVVEALMQYGFDLEAMLDFPRQAHANGILIPIIQGIIPVRDFSATARMAARHGVMLPGWMAEHFEGRNPEIAKIEFMAGQISYLVYNGVRRLHLYPLNDPDCAKSIELAQAHLKDGPPRPGTLRLGWAPHSLISDRLKPPVPPI